MNKNFKDFLIWLRFIFIWLAVLWAFFEAHETVRTISIFFASVFFAHTIAEFVDGRDPTQRKE